MPCCCFWWGMQRFEQVRRKPQLFVFERSEEFCAAGASPYRPVPRIAPDTQKPPNKGAFCYGGEYKESSGRGRQPSAVRVRSTAENFAAHAASPYRPLPRITSDTLKPPKTGGLLRGRFSASAGGFRIKPPAEVKTRANTTETPFPYPSACVRSCSERNTCA